MKQLTFLFAISLSLFAFNSCQKNEIPTVIDEVSVSQQETQADEILADIDLLVDEAIDLNISQLKSATMESSIFLTDCPIVTTDKTASPQVMTLDFGTGCTGRDGKIRSGKITVTSTSFNTFPSVRSKTFTNFVVDGKKIEGSIVKTISKDQVNNIRTAQLQENITITFPNSEGIAQRVANLTREYQRNELAKSTDNQIVSWGTVEFTRKSGVKISKSILAENPLVFEVACHHIVSGIVLITTSNNSWKIDYGTGACDNIATLTINGKTQEIRIR